MTLPDVSVLIALVDVDHDDHVTAHSWFSKARDEGWATCPITENGVVRIVGGNTYPNSLGLSKSFALVETLLRLPGHIFWPDDFSLFNSERIAAQHISGVGQITDAYLLALAVSHSAKFVTLDRRIKADAVTGGANAVVILKS